MPASHWPASHASAPSARRTNEGAGGRGLGRGGEARLRASIGRLSEGRSRCLRRPRRRDEPPPPVPPAEAGAAVRDPGCARPGQHHVRGAGRLALCSVYARVLGQGHRWTRGEPGQVPGLRVHRHQRGLAMRQDGRKLHSACRPARPIC